MNGTSIFIPETAAKLSSKVVMPIYTPTPKHRHQPWKIISLFCQYDGQETVLLRFQFAFTAHPALSNRSWFRRRLIIFPWFHISFSKLVLFLLLLLLIPQLSFSLVNVYQTLILTIKAFVITHEAIISESQWLFCCLSLFLYYYSWGTGSFVKYSMMLLLLILWHE